MLVREETIKERTGQQAQATERDGRKPLRNATIGKCSQRADIFTDEELERFFNSKVYEDSERYLFYLCYLTAGLHPGEARGLHPKQILFDRAMLIVDGAVKKNGEKTAYTREGHRDYWKLRIVPLPDLTLGMLKEQIERKGLKDDDFIFAAKNDLSRPIAEHYVRDHMERIIKAAGIPAQGRRLTINSFRYTFINRIRRELPTGVVMKLVGRKLFGIMEHYHNQSIDESSTGLAGVDTALEKLLTKAE